MAATRKPRPDATPAPVRVAAVQDLRRSSAARPAPQPPPLPPPERQALQLLRGPSAMPIDYARARRESPAQKSALTRAVNSKDPAKVRAACAKAVKAWDAWGAWPDDWSRWQRALDDALGWRSTLRLEDLDDAS